MAVPPVDGKFPCGNLHQRKKTGLPHTCDDKHTSDEVAPGNRSLVQSGKAVVFCIKKKTYGDLIEISHWNGDLVVKY